MTRRLRRAVLRAAGRAERPAAWALLAGAAVTFVGVLVQLIDVGEFRLGTLLISADLLVSGWSAVQDAEDDDDEDGPRRQATPEDGGRDYDHLRVEYDHAVAEIARLRRQLNER